MAKLKAGDKMPNFTFDTAYETGKTLYPELEGPTFIWFLRYYGCTVCQVDIHRLQENYGDFLAKGAKVMVVMQSKPAVIAGEVPPGKLPFDIICDPEMKLYEELEILPAKNMLGLASLKLPAKMKEAKALGFEHGEYEGNEQQLPALFLLDADGTVKFAHYAKNLTDMPPIAQMLQMV